MFVGTTVKKVLLTLLPAKKGRQVLLYMVGTAAGFLLLPGLLLCALFGMAGGETDLLPAGQATGQAAGQELLESLSEEEKEQMESEIEAWESASQVETEEEKEENA